MKKLLLLLLAPLLIYAAEKEFDLYTEAKRGTSKEVYEFYSFYKKHNENVFKVTTIMDRTVQGSIFQKHGILVLEYIKHLNGAEPVIEWWDSE